MVATFKTILAAYQKKTDYKPEGTAVAEGTQVRTHTEEHGFESMAGNFHGF